MILTAREKRALEKFRALTEQEKSDCLALEELLVKLQASTDGSTVKATGSIQ